RRAASPRSDRPRSRRPTGNFPENDPSFVLVLKSVFGDRSSRLDPDRPPGRRDAKARLRPARQTPTDPDGRRLAVERPLEHEPAGRSRRPADRRDQMISVPAHAEIERTIRRRKTANRRTPSLQPARGEAAAK